MTPTPRTIDSAAITIGMPITPYHVRASTVQLFRFSAATWNAHRIHYDSDYAKSEGYPDILVQSHLHGCYLANAVLQWAGPHAVLRTFSWENRGIAVADDALTVTGEVTAVTQDHSHTLIDVSLEERNDRGILCAPGQAALALPRTDRDRRTSP